MKPDAPALSAVSERAPGSAGTTGARPLRASAAGYQTRSQSHGSGTLGALPNAPILRSISAVAVALIERPAGSWQPWRLCGASVSEIRAHYWRRCGARGI